MSYTRFNALIWILRLAASIILLQTLFFKFTAAPESVYIFTKIGMESWGRVGSGVIELTACVLILIPRTTSIGALFAIGTMSRAIFYHLTELGIDVLNDKGRFFALDCSVFVCSAILLFIFREQLFGFYCSIENRLFCFIKRSCN
jgi:uncharacterized membrane protein YphA (DoxX/SURF4 family)